MQTFLEQMCENVKSNLIYPYHIKQDKLIPNDGVVPVFNPEMADSYHTHDFDSLLREAYKQPKAFYLTEADRFYYSPQEIALLDKVIERESKKIDEGCEIVTLEIDEATDELLEQYCAEHNMTHEEAIVDILTRFINEHKDNK